MLAGMTNEVGIDILKELRAIRKLLEKSTTPVYNVTIVDKDDHFQTALDDIRSR